MLVIDGNSVYEIDEECIKNRMISKKCDLPEEWLPHVPVKYEDMEQDEAERRK